MEPTNQGETPKLSQVIQIDEGKIQEHLGEVVRSTVEETLNAMLDAEADRLCRAERYERTEARKDTRAGKLHRHRRQIADENQSVRGHRVDDGEDVLGSDDFGFPGILLRGSRARVLRYG